MLPQLSQVEAYGIKAFADHYGAFAFGVVAVCILLLVLSAIWLKVFKPTLDVQLKIAEQNALSTNNIAATAACLQLSLVESKAIAERQADILRRLERLEQDNGESPEQG